MSRLNAGKNFDLRCQVREGLIEFLRARSPESLPRVRLATGPLRDEPSDTEAHPGVVEGQVHERGSSAPGLAAEKEIR